MRRGEPTSQQGVGDWQPADHPGAFAGIQGRQGAQMHLIGRTGRGGGRRAEDPRPAAQRVKILDGVILAAPPVRPPWRRSWTVAIQHCRQSVDTELKILNFSIPQCGRHGEDPGQWLTHPPHRRRGVACVQPCCTCVRQTIRQRHPPRPSAGASACLCRPRRPSKTAGARRMSGGLCGSQEPHSDW